MFSDRESRNFHLIASYNYYQNDKATFVFSNPVQILEFFFSGVFSYTQSFHLSTLRLI